MGLCVSAFAQLPLCLPPDESAALEMLSRGELDSSLWVRIRPFYEEPLAVAKGELRYLADFFPELANQLPLSSNRLKKYEPWDDVGIRCFFADYPALVPLQPILDFAVPRTMHVGTAALRIRYRPLHDTVGVFSRFDAKVGPYVAAQASATIDNNRAKWNRRGIMLSLPARVEAQLGNYSQQLAQGLVGGYFYSSLTPLNDVAANWAYGALRSWNGVRVKVQEPTYGGVSAFVHARPTEKMVGAEVFGTIGTIEVVGGISAAEVAKSIDSLAAETNYTLHGGMTVRRNVWKAVCHAAADLRKPRAIPVAFSAQHSAGETKFDVKLVRIPRSYRAALSALQRSLSQALTKDKNSLDDDIIEMSLQLSQSPREWWPGMATSVLSIFGHDRTYCEASYGVWGTALVDYRLRYQWQPAIVQGPSRHSGSAWVGYACMRRLYLSSNVSCSSELPGRLISLKLTTTVDWTAMPSVQFSPFVSAVIRPVGRVGTTYGVRQTIDLFEKTRGEFCVQWPTTNTSTDGILLQAKTSFFF